MSFSSLKAQQPPLVSVHCWVARTFEMNQLLIHFMFINAAKSNINMLSRPLVWSHCFISRHQKNCKLSTAFFSPARLYTRFKVQGYLLFVTYTIIQGIISSEMHGRNHHILRPPQCWKNTNLSPPIIGLLYCNMWHMICPPFMNPGWSLVDTLLFPIYFQFRKNKGNKTVWPPPLDCTLGWARKRRLAASFEKTAQSDCHWELKERSRTNRRTFAFFSDDKQVDT